MSRLVLAGRVAVVLAGIAPPIGLALLAHVTLGQGGWRPGAVYWLAVLTLLLFVPSLVGRATRWDAAVAGAAALGFWVGRIRH